MTSVNPPASQDDPMLKRFVATLDQWPNGYRTGLYKKQRYGVSLDRLIDGRVTKLFAEALDGSDIVSFNLFRLQENRVLLKPCEMSSAKVLQFVAGFKPDKPHMQV